MLKEQLIELLQEHPDGTEITLDELKTYLKPDPSKLKLGDTVVILNIKYTVKDNMIGYYLDSGKYDSSRVFTMHLPPYDIGSILAPYDDKMLIPYFKQVGEFQGFSTLAGLNYFVNLVKDKINTL